MTHLTRVQFVDAAEGHRDSWVDRHLDGCERCRQELASLTRVLRDAQAGDVPEPSPLFWDHFSARVATAIREEGRPTTEAWRGWFHWSRLVPLGALGALVVALVTSIPSNQSAVWTPADVARVYEPLESPLGVEGDWRELADLVGPLDWDAASDAGLTLVPGAAEVAALDLTDEERRELSQLIAGELARAKS